jgi:hypothetical protein
MTLISSPAILLTLSLGIAFVSEATMPGSLIPEQLVAVDQVHVVVGTGGLIYDPVPGIDPGPLEARLTERITQQLNGSGVAAADSGYPMLILGLRREWPMTGERNVVGLFATLDLVEKVVRVDENGVCEALLSATTWGTERAFVTSVATAGQRLVETVDLMA